MRLPKINLKKLKAEMERNRKERLEFVDKHAEWLKSAPNKKWSRQQKEIID
ncbi:MAG: hypothetical protein V1820_05695 [archaeon]